MSEMEISRRQFMKTIGIGLIGLAGVEIFAKADEPEQKRRIYCHAIGDYVYPEPFVKEGINQDTLGYIEDIYPESIDYALLPFKTYQLNNEKIKCQN